MKGTMLENKNTRPSYKGDNLDYDMAFSKSLREKVPICNVVNPNYLVYIMSILSV